MSNETTQTATAEAPRATWLAGELSAVLTVEGKLPWALDDEGNPRVLEFDLERPGTWGAMQAVHQALAAKPETSTDRSEAAFGTLAAVVVDTRGLPDFPPRERDERGEFTEPVDVFRARWAAYFRTGCDGLLVPTWHVYTNEAFPDAKRRASFRP
jgi:hypothetical protein